MPSNRALLANLIEAKGVDAWYDLDMAEWLGGDASDYERVTDILDVWFDSGVTHHGVLDYSYIAKRAAERTMLSGKGLLRLPAFGLRSRETVEQRTHRSRPSLTSIHTSTWTRRSIPTVTRARKIVSPG